jgi:hypothetical protein
MYNKIHGGKMRSLFILMAILSIATMSISCLPTKAAGPSATDTAQDATIADVKRSVQSLADTKVNGDTFNLLKGRVDTMEVKVNASGAGNSYDRSQLYTKAEVDAAISAAITALKTATDQTWIKAKTGTSTGGTGGTVAGEYGELVDTDGDLELWLEKVSGDVSDVLITRNGVSDGRFDLVVVNKDASASHDFRISLSLTPDSDVILYDSTGAFNTTRTSITPSGGLLFTVSRVNSSRNPLYAYQSNEGRITKGDNEDYTIFITVDQLSASTSITEWDYSLTIDDRD